MTSRVLAGAAAVAALAMLSSPALHVAPRAWMALLLGGLPALMILQARQLHESGPLPRMAAYVSSILSLWILAFVTLAFARVGGIRPADMGLLSMPLPLLLVWTGAFTIAALAVVLLFHRAGFRESSTTRELVPVTANEKTVFMAVSATAGICEEIVFRGFLVTALYTASGSVVLAVVISSFAFGVVHAYQQPAGALRAGLLGALLAVPFVVTGSLIPSILAHTLVDVVAGLWLARYLTADPA